MHTNEKSAAIGRVPLFNGVAGDELKELANRTAERKLAKGEVLFAAGEEAHGLYVIVEGAIRAYRHNSEREQVIQVERGGATIGEAAVFDGGPYLVTAAADEDSRVLFISKQDFEQFLLGHQRVARSALELLARRLRGRTELVESLALREVAQRLARFLLTEARTNGCRTGGGLQFEMALSKRQIAARVGTVREVVSRTLKRLEQEGLIEIAGRQVTIPDENSLEAFLRDNP